MTTELERLRGALLVGDAIRNLPTPEPLVARWLTRNSLAVLYGPPGSMKTFVTIDWAVSIATGSWWFGHEVQPGPVLYVIAEGAEGAGARLEAWQKHRLQPTVGDQLIWLPTTVNLFRQRPRNNAVAQLAGEIQPALVVFDTFARSTAGAEENSARDLGIIIERADEVREASRACVLFVHHSGKDIGRGLRGSSALEGAVDTSIRCDGAENRVTLTVEKQKNAPAGHTIRLRLIQQGDSAVLTDRYTSSTDTPELLNSDRRALDALAAIEIPGGVPTGVWEKATDLGRTFYNARKRLLDHGLVVNLGNARQPRYATATATALQED